MPADVISTKGRNQMRTVILANTAEAFEQQLRKVSQTQEGMRRIRHELTLSQRAFFWGGDDKIVITPHQIPEALVLHNAALCGYSNVVNYYPAKETVALSKAVLGDKVLLDRLAILVQEDNGISFSPYAITDSYLRLLKTVSRSAGMDVSTEKSNTVSEWLTRYFDSKAGFRAEMQKLMAMDRIVLIPEGFVARNISEAMDMAEWFYVQGRSSVIKVNFGESGWGLWILKSKEYANIEAARRTFRSHISRDPVWRNTLLVVEEFIEPDKEIAGGSPSAELFIGNNGPQVTYCCGQLLDAGTQFFGIEMGKGVFSSRTKNALVRTAMIIGNHYHSLGYRGFCDIDFIVSKGCSLYAIETNPRRTGGTHVYDLAKRLFGDAWEKDRYFLSHDSFRYGNYPIRPEDLLKKMSPLLFPVGGQKGIVITSINLSDPVMGYVIVAMNRQDGDKLQQQVFDLFGIVR
jgi:hypothetical protein